MKTFTPAIFQALSRVQKVQTFFSRLFFGLILSMFFMHISAQVIRSGSGANAAAIQSAVDQFRTDLGALNSNVSGSFGTGRREINWDGVPDAFAAPNNLPADFFNVNSPRGAVFSTAGTGFQVSANSSNPTSTPVEFNNINATYSSLFAPFSAQRLFTSLSSNITDVSFFFPGSTTAAQVRGFGAVFSDVDLPNVTSIQFFDKNNVSLGSFFAPVAAGNETLSFLGVSFATPSIARVRITAGNAALGSGVNESVATDLVAMDDFIYGEPVSGQVTLRSATGVNIAAIQATVDQYRTDLGTLNTNVAGSFGTGRREINWDGVPDQFAAPNNLPPDFFNVNSPRGVILATPGTGLQVSANATNPTSTPVEFNNLNPAYSTLFAPFSAQRLFTSLSSNITDITFFVPGSTTSALTRGLGSVFTDVDLSGVTSIQYFDQNNTSLGTYLVPATTGNETFSFLGISYPAPTVLRIRITSGNTPMGVSETPSADLVAMDDFIYGEPVSLASLPVKFTSIKASQKSSGINVEWTVANEGNTKEYQVEKSIDGRSFSKATAIAAIKNNNSTSYKWFDAQPNNGWNYYRIKVIAADGDIKYSEIVRVNTHENEEGISIYPNPLTGNQFSLQLSNKSKGDYAVRLYNSAGQTTYNKTITHDGGSATETIHLTAPLIKGVYHLNIISSNGTNETIKLLRSN
jgi:hypothetical protein